MALIDEYKQAIQDVLDGRAKPAPRPSELPWTEDKAATMWAAAAAELIAEANGGGGGGGGLLVTLTYNPDPGLYFCDKTAKEMWDAAQNGVLMFDLTSGSDKILYALNFASKNSSSGSYNFTMSTGESFEAYSDSEYPSGVIS